MTDETSTAAPDAPVARSRPRLTWIDGSGPHMLEISEVRTAGAAPGCEIVIADRAVSRLHAEFVPLADGLWVRDLGSRNGTHVDGTRVEGARVPSNGTVRLGTTDITISYNPAAVPETWPEETFGQLSGRSSGMREIFAAMNRLSKTDVAVLVVGAPGTGKRTIARALHDAANAERPFVVVDCGALPGLVQAAELFEEALRTAEGGTLLLDEPSELPLALQRELVPPLDARVFRVITTTQHDLRRLVNQGAFREGLYFRLAGATLRVPALRDRADDIGPLLQRFLEGHAALVTPDFIAELERLPWTGNVRELRLYAERLRAFGVERAIPMAEPPPDHDLPNESPFDPEITVASAPSVPPTPVIPTGVEPWFDIGFKEFRERWIELGEREYLRRLMLRTNRSSSIASREAGVERTYLYRLIKKHGV